MLHLILGTDWTANRNEIMNRLAGDVGHGRGGRILMVPELISHDTERRLCEAAGDTASRYAEVLSFTRLARRVAEYARVPDLDCMDNGGRVVAMAASARSLHSRLKAYAALETKPEFLKDLVDAVDEFKRCRITSQDLMEASHSTEGALAQKLEELALLLDAYDGLCAQGKRDPRDRETRLLELLEDCDFGETHSFYIDGFPDFTRQHMAILEHLLRVSPSVTVALTCDRVSSGTMAFEKAGETASQLLRCAWQAGVEVQIEPVQPKASALEPLRQRLFQGKTEPVGPLQVFQAGSVYQEVSETARRILDLVRSGCRYRDISVVCGDAAAYQDTVELVFRRCGIPVYRSGTEEVLRKNVISALLCALDGALGGFEQREVLRYLKSMLSGLEPDRCDLLENYAVVWGIRGSKWLTPWENHPDGLGESWTEDASIRLRELNRDRAAVMEPLARLGKSFEQAPDLGEQVQAVYDFLEELELGSRLAAMAEEMDASGDNRSAQILNQLWEIILTALEQMHAVLGRTKWDSQSFVKLFTLLLTQYDVGTIPPVLDAVMMGSVSAMRCQEPKYLFVLGVEEGALPGYGGSAGVLTDQDRVKLRQLGVPLTGGAMEGIQAEFAEIYGVFCGARENVTVSCAGQPSFLFRRLEAMTGREAASVEGSGVIADPDSAAAYLARTKDLKTAEALGIEAQYEAVRDRSAHGLGVIGQENIRGLYGKQLRLSASQVDRQGECRLSYFLKYGLRAKERREITIDPAEFGTYVHAVLEKTARAVMEAGGFHTVSLEETMDLARQYSEEYAADRFSQLDSERLAYLFRRNGQELELVVRELWQELSQSRFAPVDFETDFGGQGEMEAIPIPGRTMDARLRGFVDRVDAWKEQGQNYFRVVDYKTGRKDFDYCDVFNGIGLQMLLYLFALEQAGEGILGDDPVPAGVQYFPARVPLISTDGRLTSEEAEQLRKKEWRRRGLLLQDEEVLRAMEPDENSNRLGVTKKKDGTLSGDLADREQLKLLKAYLFRVLGRMVDDIASGNVEPNPYTRGSSHDACAFCPYGAVCHKDRVEGRRNYQAMSAQRFWEEVGKEMDHG